MFYGQTGFISLSRGDNAIWRETKKKDWKLYTQQDAGEYLFRVLNLCSTKEMELNEFLLPKRNDAWQSVEHLAGADGSPWEGVAKKDKYSLVGAFISFRLQHVKICKGCNEKKFDKETNHCRTLSFARPSWDLVPFSLPNQ